MRLGPCVSLRRAGLATLVLAPLALPPGLLLGATPARAGESEVRTEALRRFALGTAADVAWGAWLAGEHGLTDLVPQVAEHLRCEALPLPEPDPEAQARWPLRAVLLDAATRLDATLDAELLTCLSRSHPAHVAVQLVTHLPRCGSEALAVFRAWQVSLPRAWQADESFVALGAALGATRTPGFAALLLDGWEPRRRLEVCSPPEEGVVHAPGPPPAEDGVVADGRIPIPAGFPPVAVPRLSLRADLADRLLTPGPRGTPDVFVSRTLEAGEAIGFGQVGAFLDPPAWCFRWTHALLPQALGERLPVPFEEWRVEWTGRQPFERALAPALRALEQGWYDALRDLVRQALLTPEEAAQRRLRITVDVEDVRDLKRPRLPPLPLANLPHPFVRRPRRSPAALRGV